VNTQVQKLSFEQVSRVVMDPRRITNVDIENNESRGLVAVVSVWPSEGPSGTGGASGRGVHGGALPRAPRAFSSAVEHST